jgi:hypothetical protein
MKFDNQKGLRHIRWLISQTTAISPTNIQFRCAEYPHLSHEINCSNTLGELCGIFLCSRDAHIIVRAEPPRGRHRDLGIITVERIGTLRPQQNPPYQAAAVRFHEQYTDYDYSAFYYDRLQFTSEQTENNVFQISLQLPFHSDLIVKEFAGDITISNVLPWFSHF